jgi:hypothetical protein
MGHVNYIRHPGCIAARSAAVLVRDLPREIPCLQSSTDVLHCARDDEETGKL